MCVSPVRTHHGSSWWRKSRRAPPGCGVRTGPALAHAGRWPITTRLTRGDGGSRRARTVPRFVGPERGEEQAMRPFLSCDGGVGGGERKSWTLRATVPAGTRQDSDEVTRQQSLDSGKEWLSAGDVARRFPSGAAVQLRDSVGKGLPSTGVTRSGSAPESGEEHRRQPRRAGGRPSTRSKALRRSGPWRSRWRGPGNGASDPSPAGPDSPGSGRPRSRRGQDRGGSRSAATTRRRCRPDVAAPGGPGRVRRRRLSERDGRGSRPPRPPSARAAHLGPPAARPARCRGSSGGSGCCGPTARRCAPSTR